MDSQYQDAEEGRADTSGTTLVWTTAPSSHAGSWQPLHHVQFQVPPPPPLPPPWNNLEQQKWQHHGLPPPPPPPPLQQPWPSTLNFAPKQPLAPPPALPSTSSISMPPYPPTVAPRPASSNSTTAGSPSRWGAPKNKKASSSSSGPVSVMHDLYNPQGGGFPSFASVARGAAAAPPPPPAGVFGPPMVASLDANHKNLQQGIFRGMGIGPVAAVGTQETAAANQNNYVGAALPKNNPPSPTRTASISDVDMDVSSSSDEEYLPPPPSPENASKEKNVEVNSVKTKKKRKRGKKKNKVGKKENRPTDGNNVSDGRKKTGSTTTSLTPTSSCNGSHSADATSVNHSEKAKMDDHANGPIHENAVKQPPSLHVATKKKQDAAAILQELARKRALLKAAHEKRQQALLKHRASSLSDHAAAAHNDEQQQQDLAPITALRKGVSLIIINNISEGPEELVRWLPNPWEQDDGEYDSDDTNLTESEVEEQEQRPRISTPVLELSRKKSESLNQNILLLKRKLELKTKALAAKKKAQEQVPGEQDKGIIQEGQKEVLMLKRKLELKTKALVAKKKTKEQMLGEQEKGVIQEQKEEKGVKELQQDGSNCVEPRTQLTLVPELDIMVAGRKVPLQDAQKEVPQVAPPLATDVDDESQPSVFLREEEQPEAEAETCGTSTATAHERVMTTPAMKLRLLKRKVELELRRKELAQKRQRMETVEEEAGDLTLAEAKESRKPRADPNEPATPSKEALKKRQQELQFLVELKNLNRIMTQQKHVLAQHQVRMEDSTKELKQVCSEIEQEMLAQEQTEEHLKDLAARQASIDDMILTSTTKLMDARRRLDEEQQRRRTQQVVSSA